MYIMIYKVYYKQLIISYKQYTCNISKSNKQQCWHELCTP